MKSAGPTISSRLRRHAPGLAELWRFYSVGLINTVFGFTVYAVLVRLGLDLFVAQILSHVAGATFNYFMFRLHVFRGSRPELWRYVASYGFNYLVSLTILAVVNRFLAPVYDTRLLAAIIAVGGGGARAATSYVSGVITLVAASVMNYFVLKRFVFRTAA